MKTIAIEGADYFGKSTLAEMLYNELDYILIKLPNERLSSGIRIRNILHGVHSFDAEEFQRLQNQNKRDTLDCLPSNLTYIFDRYKLSEIVYGLANGLSREYVMGLADKIPDPDVTILITGRPYYREDSDIYSGREYQKKVKALYKEEGKNLDGRVIWICNYDSPEHMLEKVLSELKGVV